jgi:hypothetical protein
LHFEVQAILADRVKESSPPLSLPARVAVNSCIPSGTAAGAATPFAWQPTEENAGNIAVGITQGHLIVPSMRSPLTTHSCKLIRGQWPNTADPPHASTKHTQQASCNMMHNHVYCNRCLDTFHATMHEQRAQIDMLASAAALLPSTKLQPGPNVTPQNALHTAIDALNGTSGESRAWFHVIHDTTCCTSPKLLAVEVHSSTA